METKFEWTAIHKHPNGTEIESLAGSTTANDPKTNGEPTANHFYYADEKFILICIRVVLRIIITVIKIIKDW